MGNIWERLTWGDGSELQAGAMGYPSWHCSELFADLFFRKSERWWLLY